MFDVITVGSATVDCFVYTDKSELISIKTADDEKEFIAYPSGTKMLIRDLYFNTGGGGTNTAVSFSRLGLKTAYVGALGSDDNGHLVLRELAREKVQFLGKILKAKTDFSVILNSIDHDRTILNYKGTSTHLSFAGLKLARLKKTRWFYFSSQVGESYRTLEKLAAFARKVGIKLAFNPSSYIAEKGAKFVGPLLRLTDVLILNKEEAQDIVGGTDISRMLRALKEFGPEHVIITDGRNGVHALCGRECLSIATHKVKVVESTGAGDAFASAFVAGLILGKDARTALQYGMANAESVIGSYGAKNELLTLKKLRAHIRACPYQIKKF